MQCKAQSSIEFAALIGFMMFTFITFLVIVSGKLMDIQDDNELLALEAIGSQIQNELKLASLAVDGYRREFTVPMYSHGLPYNVTIHRVQPGMINHSEIVLHYSEGNAEVVLPLAGDVVGNIEPSTVNTVKLIKQNNVVFISS